MKIEKMRTCHLSEPLGARIVQPVFSWVVSESTGRKQKNARLRISADERMTELLFDTGVSEDLSSLAVPVSIPLRPRTRYYWQVEVTADDGDHGVSDVASFETAKRDEPWAGKWIRAPFDDIPVFFRSFHAESLIERARLYICGLGQYEASLNGQRISDEIFTPGFDSYQYQIQYQTYDVTGLLREGDNELDVMLGKGWYMGRFGFGAQADCLYGTQMQMLCELHIDYANGQHTVLVSDEQWTCSPSPVTDGNFYDGEVFDSRLLLTAERKSAIPAEAPEGSLIERIGEPVKVLKTFTEYELLHTSAGELVLDFGQNMAGWATFSCTLPEGQKVRLQYGELLQDGCFYRDTLRTAQAEYTYISNGTAAEVRPHFTFFGFRYVKVEGMSDAQIRNASFRAEAIWSGLDPTGTLLTSNEKVNRLIQNALWSQRGNFVDIPTDCPQRDERMGWTGDAQVFSETASYNMYTPAFYSKYLSDMLLEQRARGGSVPYVVPDALTVRRMKLGGRKQMEETDRQDGSCAWGDAATVIPWNLYCYYGDRTLLAEQYENMRLWVEYIRHEDETKCDNTHIWSSGFHFADWLALDNPNKESRLGGTETAYVATCYYYLSAVLTMKAARVLGKSEDAARYERLAADIRNAFRERYVNADGSLRIQTQTAHVLALNLDLVPPEQRPVVAAGLRERLQARGDHLDTGFVGTYQLCPVLSRYGMTDVAYTLLLNEDYPSWLYEVNLGATTIWERWNSVLPDGHVSDTGMNSMNHYAYGSIVQWIYQTVTGLRPDEHCPGFRHAIIRPEPDRRLDWAECRYDSAAGRYTVRWERNEHGILYTVAIPFNASACFTVPEGSRITRVNGQSCEDNVLELQCGEYEIEAEEP
ncbi:MAG: family 78 glycoside hydrolase catalytic domain [Clostridia bacterium]|nr:family 78 glycoside hydrolase catalytic domain [Clostridia bacterium]